MMEKTEQELMDEAKEREFPKERPHYWPDGFDWPPNYLQSAPPPDSIRRHRANDITG